MHIIDGKKLRDELLLKIKEDVQKLPFSPVFSDVMVGEDKVSLSYVRIKEKFANLSGIKFRETMLSSSATTEEVIEQINNLNNVPFIGGVIVQLPLPDHIDTEKVLNSINVDLDVDCLSGESTLSFYNNNPIFSYPTALACVYILESLKLDLKDKSILVIGNGRLVGKPVSHLLKSKGLNVITIDSKTENKNDFIKEADVIITAIGKGKFLTGDMVKSGVVIIDAGTSEEDGGIVGDVDMDSMQDVASYITPCPGGVGPVTVAMLLSNVLESAKRKKYE